MLLVAGLLLLRMLALGMLVVPTLGLKFNFSDIQQCGPVVTNFTGADILTVPTSLSILPLNSTAIVVPLQNPALISSGIIVSSLPLAAGSDFLASLDDASGENLIPISDLIRILPSGDSSCLPNAGTDSPRRFTVGPTVSQCEDLTIYYDTSVVSKAPTVRLYTPRGVAFTMLLKSDDPASGTATFTLNALRGLAIVLLMDDGADIRETSPLLTVTGDSASDTSCFKFSATNSSTASTTNSNSTNTGGMNYNESTTSGGVGVLDDTPVGISKNVIIGSAIGGAALFFIAIAMVIFVVMDRRRRRQIISSGFEPSAMDKSMDMEKGGSIARAPPQSRQGHTNSGVVANPIYTTDSFLSLGKPNEVQDALAYRPQRVREDQRYSIPVSASSPVLSSRIVVVSPPASDRPERQSLESLDIEGMLNMAMLQSENSSASRKNSYASVLGPVGRVPLETTPPATFLRSETSRRQLRSVPSDVSPDPTSMAFSGYSVNPFDSQDVVFQEPLRTGDSFRSPDGGLPRSPRAPTSNPTRIFSGVSGRYSSDWYGIAR